MGSLCVQVGSFLGWSTPAAAVTAIIESENADARVQQCSAHIQSVTNVSSVSVADEDGE